jgi:hypothetical protein
LPCATIFSLYRGCERLSDPAELDEAVRPVFKRACG